LDSRHNSLISSDYGKARQANGGEILSQAEYYRKHSADILAGTHTETYSGYLKSIESDKSSYDAKQKHSRDEGIIGATTSGYNNSTGSWFDLKLWADGGEKEDKEVKLGAKPDTNTKNRLNALLEAEKGEFSEWKDASYHAAVVGNRLYI
jgi:hypothetical protein